MNQVITFIQEAKAEFKKVNWPTRQQVINYTVLIVCVSIFVAAFLGGLDYFFGQVIENVILK